MRTTSDEWLLPTSQQMHWEWWTEPLQQRRHLPLEGTRSFALKVQTQNLGVYVVRVMYRVGPNLRKVTGPPRVFFLAPPLGRTAAEGIVSKNISSPAAAFPAPGGSRFCAAPSPCVPLAIAPLRGLARCVLERMEEGKAPRWGFGRQLDRHPPPRARPRFVSPVSAHPVRSQRRIIHGRMVCMAW